MAPFLGLDPGGRSSSANRKAGEAFGWALLRGEDLHLKVVKTGTVNDAKGAVGVFTDLIQEDQDPLLSAAIDARSSLAERRWKFCLTKIGTCHVLPPLV